MSLEIPTFTDSAFYTQTVLLEGKAYNLRFRYNTSMDRWYMHLADDADIPILDGVKLVCNKALNRLSADPRNPTGVLMCQSQTSDDSPPGLKDLGDRVRLFYFTLAELNEAEP